MLKASENPPITWPQDKKVAEIGGNWWVAHTKSRNEKALANDLAARGVAYFLPMSWKMHRRRGRKVRALLPVFGGYVFFSGDQDDRLEVLRTNRVANIIAVNDQEKLIRELSQIERAVLAGAPMVPHHYLKAGQPVRVTAGPLKDLQGIVVKSSNVTRLVLQVDILGQATSVEVDSDTIEPV